MFFVLPSRPVPAFIIPVGPLIADITDAGLVGLEFDESRRCDRSHATELSPSQAKSPAQRHLERLGDELAAYFAGTLREFSVPLCPSGTAFQERVWAALRQ